MYVQSAASAAESLQPCPTLGDPIDGSSPSSAVPGILQARTMEWVAISFSNAWKWKVNGKSLSHVRLFATPWTAAYQAPPSMRFSRQEYWSGVPLSSLMYVHRSCHIKILYLGTIMKGWLCWWLSGKESTYQWKKHGFDAWVGKIPWRRKWQLSPVVLPGESHGQRSLAGYNQWSCKRGGRDLVTEQ